MRTTIDLPDHLMAAARRRADAEHTSVREIVAEALARYLRPGVESEKPAPRFRVPVLPGRGGMLPGIDPTDTSAMLEIE